MKTPARCIVWAFLAALAIPAIATSYDRDDRREGREAAYRAGFDSGYRSGLRTGAFDFRTHFGYGYRGRDKLRGNSHYYFGWRSRNEGDYKKGYRDGFRQGYREGYDSYRFPRDRYSRKDYYDFRR